MSLFCWLRRPATPSERKGIPLSSVPPDEDQRMMIQDARRESDLGGSVVTFLVDLEEDGCQ